MMPTRCVVNFIQRRGMATEKQLKNRITATINISKITKSMKMVSASKLRGDQARLNFARPFAKWTDSLGAPARKLEDLDTADFPDNNLFVIMSTDKGLCGGVNSILARQTRQALSKLDAQGKKYQLLVLGEKGRVLFRRSHMDKLLSTYTERTAPYNFNLAASVAQEVFSGDYNAVHVIFNTFKSAISYIPSIKTITPIVDGNTEFFQSKYDLEPDIDNESLANFYEYSLATQLYHALMENATSEQSSRMNAMENASKNAGEMINSLRLKYNRARQTRITTELIEIISGASALEVKK